eukprot:4489664-Pleurochrysis_carterae.AAC.1
MYGHPTARRKWYKTASKTFIEFGLTQSEYDPCLFYMVRGNEMLIVLRRRHHHRSPHTRGPPCATNGPRTSCAHFRWADFGTNLQEFVSIRLRQSFGVIRLDSERYITGLANE